jgi:hypothetical protein
MMTMRTMRKVCAIAALLVLAVPTAARAQTDEDAPESQLAGYAAGAAGWAFSFQPTLPALVSTGDVPFETTLSLSNASVKSGGIAAARGAILWPGSAAANLGPLIGVAAGQPAIGALIPPWPAAVEATADSGEVTRNAGPGFSMRAFGSENRAEGDVRAPDVNFPGVLRIHSVASTSVAEVTDVDVTSSCAVHLEGVSILDGAITFDTIHSRSLTRSTGASSNAEGVVQVVGLKVTGIAAELTGDGLHATGFPPEASEVPGLGAAFPGANPDDALNQALSALGASIKLTRATDNVAGGRADRLANGVLITINNPAIAGSHLDITLASTGSAAQATLPLDLSVSGLELSAGGDELGDALNAGGAGTSTPPSSDFSSSTIGDLALGSPSGGVSPSLSSPQTGSGELNSALAGYHFDGVPLSLIIVLLIASALLAHWLRRFLQARLLS